MLPEEIGRSYVYLYIKQCGDNLINANYFDSYRFSNKRDETYGYDARGSSRRRSRGDGRKIRVVELAPSWQLLARKVDSILNHRLHPFSSHNGEKVYEATDVPDTYSYRSGPRFRVIVTVIIVRDGASPS